MTETETDAGWAAVSDMAVLTKQENRKTGKQKTTNVKWGRWQQRSHSAAIISGIRHARAGPSSARNKKRQPCGLPFQTLVCICQLGEDQGPQLFKTSADQWNCSSSVEPVSAFTLELPPWITVVTSSK